MHVIFAAAAGLAVGVFCPAIARKIKAAFSAEVKKADTAAVVAVVADVKAKL
jgi:hypothetical protein